MPASMSPRARAGTMSGGDTLITSAFTPNSVSRASVKNCVFDPIVVPIFLPSRLVGSSKPMEAFEIMRLAV